MSKHKFTPCPWFMVPESSIDARNIVCQVNRDNVICSDSAPSMNGSNDANLIITAPELLESNECLIDAIKLLIKGHLYETLTNDYFLQRRRSPKLEEN